MKKKGMTYEGQDIATIESKKQITIDQLLKDYGIDKKFWEIYRVVINTWDANAGKGETIPLYQTKVWLKKKISIVNHEKFIDDLKKDLKKIVNKVPKKKRESKTKDGHLLEIDLFDVHWDKLAWAEETGSNFDTKIARDRVLRAVAALVEKAKKFKIERIVFPVGNDFFHSDNSFPYPQTTNGTPQQTDLRWQKSFREGRKLIMEVINFLSQFADVDIVVIPGNHDFQKSFYLGDVLEMAYSKNSNVTVDNRACVRKYYQYYNNLVGFSHGSPKNETEKRLLFLMPQEVPELWAKTKFREWHLGDRHHKRVIQLKSDLDHQGIIIRYMRSLTGDDAWHARKGFIGAQKGAEAYLYHKKYGMIANFNYNIIRGEK